MNSLDQYIELFVSHRHVIDSHAPAALNRRRDRALEVLTRAGRLPEKGDEGYPQLSLNEMFAPDYGLNITRIDFAKDFAPGAGCGAGAGYAATLVNDSFLRSQTPLPDGVEICPLAEAAVRYPEFFKDDIAPCDNPVVALNSLFVQDGVFIRIGRGASPSRPLQVLSVFNTSQAMMAVRRIRIVVEEDASASVLLCDHPVAGAAEGISCRVVEVSVGRRGSLNLYDLEEAGVSTRRASVTAAAQEAESTFSACSLFLNGGMTRNEFYPRHLGERCVTRLGGLVIGATGQIIDNAVEMVHCHAHCASEQLFKYALFDDARGSFEGMVKVSEGAVHSDARQSNRNLLASAGARMYAMPQLEIYCDEVKASHGSATGQLDERALFYMRQRGIPEAEARMMLVNAFMTDVLDTISDEPLRERLRHLVDVRLRGAETVCSGCGR